MYFLSMPNEMESLAKIKDHNKILMKSKDSNVQITYISILVLIQLQVHKTQLILSKCGWKCFKIHVNLFRYEDEFLTFNIYSQYLFYNGLHNFITLLQLGTTVLTITQKIKHSSFHTKYDTTKLSLNILDITC